MKNIITYCFYVFLMMSGNVSYGQLWKQYADSAEYFKGQNETDKAINFYGKVNEELKKDSFWTTNNALNNYNLAILYYNMGQYEKAEPFFLTEKQIEEKIGKNLPDYVSSCTNLAILYQAMKQYDKAETLYLEAKEIREKLFGNDNLDCARFDNNLGNLYCLMMKYDEAESLFLQTKEMIKRLAGVQDTDYVTSCYMLANVYSVTEQYVKGEQQYLEVKQLIETMYGKQSVYFANLCTELGKLYQNMKKYEMAEPYFREARQIQEMISGNQDPYYGIACLDLANLYQLMGQKIKADSLIAEVNQIKKNLSRKQSTDSTDNSYSRLWQQYADSAEYFKDQNNTRYAIKYYSKAKEVLGNNSYWSRDNAEITTSLATLYSDIRHYDKAEPLYLEAKQIQEKLFGKEHRYYAESCGYLAVLYDDLGQYGKAESLYLEAMEIQKKTLGENNMDYALTCSNLAAHYLHVGHYEKAELLLVQAKQIWKELFGNENADYGNSCSALATFYYEMGQYEKAEPLFLEAKQILEKSLGKENPEYANICSSLAGFYLIKGQYQKAEPLYQEAKQIQEKVFGKLHPDYANSCENLAVLYSTMGQFEKAEPLYLEAKKIQESVLGKEHEEYASTCRNLAGLYYEKGQYEKSRLLFIESKQILKNVLGEHHPDFGLSCRNLAITYWALDEPALAEKEFNESFSVSIFNMFSVFQFTNEKEKNAYINYKSGAEDEVYSFFISEKLSSAQPYSMSLFHRNLILSASVDLQKQLFYTNNPELIRKYNTWVNLKQQLNILYSRPVAEKNAIVSSIEENSDRLEKDLTRLSSAFKNQQQRVDWKDIQNKLEPFEASIEFASFHYFNRLQPTDSVFYVALVLRKDLPKPSTIFLFTEKELTKLLTSTGNETGNNVVKQLYKSRGIVVENNDITANKSIYDLIWKPLEKELKGIKTIYFAPSGLLHRVAFAALPVNSHEVLSDRYKLVQLATTASVSSQEMNYITSSDNLQLYGGIDYDVDSTTMKKTALIYTSKSTEKETRSLPEELTRSGSFSYLPGTETEIETIRKLAKETQNPVSLLSGTKATEESFKGLNGKSSPAVIHIATHGFFFADPKADLKAAFQRGFETTGKVFRQSDNPLFRSGLVFAGANLAWQGRSVGGIEDGILTAYEVSDMYLPNTKLVVLSACETALGDIQGNEGVYGLQRAFKIAGVQNLVMSLWKVPDTETVEFMQLFYKNMFANKSISDAFYQAQAIMKTKYRNDPYKWAAWVLVK